jgi:AmmeMemoRadiSam system protein B
MTEMRPTAVAGHFYPADPDALRALVTRLLSEADDRRPAGPIVRPKALIVPHAGYVYSGPIAATAYARLRAALGDGGPPIERVVLLGPAHRVFCRGLADAGVDFFESPLGAVPVDREALAELPGRSDGHRAHAPEHALEVQLPFLQVILPDAMIVPLLVVEPRPDVVARGLDHLWGGPETLVVVSTDLSHFLPAEAAEAVDAETARHLVSRGPPTLTGDQACGSAALNGLLAYLDVHAPETRLECIDLRHSGQTAGGRREVVGYGAFQVLA